MNNRDTYLLFMSLETLPAEDGHGPTECNQSPTFLFDAELGHLSAPVPTVSEDRWLFRTSPSWYRALFRKMWEFNFQL